MLEQLLFILGVIFLLKGADLLVNGSASLSKRFGIPSLVIGLTIVAFGTSTPELFVNLFAAKSGSSEIALGNIIGSNIANTLFILGIMALITRVRIKKATVTKEIPFALLGSIALLIFSYKYFLDSSPSLIARADGLILLLFFSIFMYHVYDQTKLGHKHLHDPRFKVEKHGILTSLFMILIGVTGLYFGGKWVVDGAVFFANQLGVSEFVISATIIAFGTSLPELVTSIMASLRSDIDLAVGNIIGSNIFNIFFILGVTSLVNPVQIPFSLMADLLLLFFVTLFLFLVLWVRGVNELDRKEGILFIAIYVAYIIFLLVRG